MKLREHEGKALFRTHGIATPQFELLPNAAALPKLSYPMVLKSQVAASDRMKKGGIVIVKDETELKRELPRLFTLAIDGMKPEVILAEELIAYTDELYVSFSYSSEHRAPILSLNKKGGTGVGTACVTSIDVLIGVDEEFLVNALKQAGIMESSELRAVISLLWKLFCDEHLILAEINPLFVTVKGEVTAGDAKIVRDEAVLPPGEKPFVPLGGNIAVIASGGGASMLNIDILMRAGGKPANYVEYSGNPLASVVEDLTIRVLSQSGLRGAWVVGGTANFTDIYETMLGFAAGLKKVSPKPTYPIIIRRDGPRQIEAKVMLEAFAKQEGFHIEVYGPELSMSASAARLVELMNI